MLVLWRFSFIGDGLSHVAFGAMSAAAVLKISGVTVAVFIFLYNRIFAVTFDEEFASACGTNAGLCNIIMAVITAGTPVGSTIVAGDMIMFAGFFIAGKILGRR